MHLVETAGPAPPHGIVSPVSSTGKVILRTARWLPNLGGAQPRGTVVICTGRSEFIEKYYEVVGDLLERGFCVVVFDWRGQGLSTRLARNPLKGHVRSFDDYGDDLDAVLRQVVEPFCPRPWFGLGHSMGGPVLLHYAAECPDIFKRLILSAPMIGIGRLPIPDAAPTIAKWAVRLGFGRRFVPVGGESSRFVSTYQDNVLTSDLRRFDKTAALLRAEPRLGISRPTLSWLNAAFDSMAALQTDDFADRMTTPSLVVMPGSDLVVDTRAVEHLVARLRGSAMVIIRNSRHEVMMERDSLREQFWAAFDAFIPGSELARTRPASPEPSRRLHPEHSSATAGT